MDKLLLRKRSLIETINDQLKNISQIEHTRHRSMTGFMVNLVAGLDDGPLDDVLQLANVARPGIASFVAQQGLRGM